MSENDLMVQRLTELREFLAVAPDDEGDFAVWNEAIGEALDTLSSRSASTVALKAKVRQLDEYVTEEYVEWSQAAADAQAARDAGVALFKAAEAFLLKADEIPSDVLPAEIFDLSGACSAFEAHHTRPRDDAR